MNAALHLACDAAVARAGAAARPAGHPRLVLTTTILASSLAMVDGSVVNVGLPAIGRSLGGGAALAWVINAYLLPLSALLLVGGALGDRLGRRVALVAGVALFALASLACALAPSLAVLLAGRAAQGIGAALLMPNSLAILGAAFEGEAKGKAVGAWAAAGAVAGAVGPVLGGWLIDNAGWRTIFLINLPLAAATIALALAVVDGGAEETAAPLDLTGAALATAGLGALTWGLTEGSGPGGWRFPSALAAAAGAALLAAFALVERAKGDRAMTPGALFASPAVVGLTLLTLALYGALGGLLVLIPYVLIKAAGYSALAAGAALLPLPLIIAGASPALGALAGRIGPRLPLTLGPLGVAAGCLLLLRVEPGAGYWTIYLPAIVMISLGMAGAVAPLTTAVLSSVDRRHTGVASGFNSAVARTGGLIATALLGEVLAAPSGALVADFHVAAIIAAGASAVAALSVFALVGRRLDGRARQA
ncbi:MAG TPA: MFS transporter [Caulobacteraceae bacterium]|jgi:EmrB/QacA subfamily drug resistance transporter|nr:MFS transporter [Caulobacteraceae bacterium]